MRSLKFLTPALGALLCSSLALAQPASLPPLPSKSGAVQAAPAASGAPAAAPAPAEAPLIDPAPADLPKASSACSTLPAEGAQWMESAFAALQAQSLRPAGAPKAKAAFADVWLFFKSSRAKGYDMDASGGRIDAIYKALYPAGPFAPESPFERFKEPRRACKKPAF